MWRDQGFGKSYWSVGRLLLAGLLMVMMMMPAFAADPPASTVSTSVSSISAQAMIDRIAEQMPSIMRMVTAIGYVLGMYFIFFSLMKFKEFGEQRTMMSSQHHLKEPLTYMVVGALLLYLPSSVQVGMSTFWAEPNPYGYLEEKDQWSSFLNNCFMMVQLFGTIAFIRGLVILSRTGHGGQGEFGKGMTHIVGGILCINIYQFVKVILWTLGIQT